MPSQILVASLHIQVDSFLSSLFRKSLKPHFSIWAKIKERLSQNAIVHFPLILYNQPSLY